MPSSSDAFGIYVHWPFCKAKCPYCDFNSHVRHQEVDTMSFAKALTMELRWFADITPGRRVSSIFFGGGTPSLMPPAAVAEVIDQIAQLWPVADTVEISLEANPTSVEAERFQGFRAAGVNRLSLGIQSLRDPALKALGRGHTAAEAVAAARLAQATFPRTSFDLIYARPGQTLEEWRAELGEALSLSAGHLSLYQLTLEEGTAYHQMAMEGRLVVPGEEEAAEFYALTQERCLAAGLPAYEISNHARPGEESRHNLIYWRYQPYIGVGPGAHGRLPKGGGLTATAQLRSPEEWLQAVEARGHGTATWEPLDRRAMAEERLLMGLRLREGVAAADVAAILNQDAAAALEHEGLLRSGRGRLAVTPAGALVLNAVIAALSRIGDDLAVPAVEL
jgi:oxygen-independent coproporphyrinogen-3 oxidase